jgi:hypothetical protein
MGKGTGTSKCRETVSLAGTAAWYDLAGAEKVLVDLVKREGPIRYGGNVHDVLPLLSPPQSPTEIEQALDSLLSQGCLLIREKIETCKAWEMEANVAQKYLDANCYQASIQSCQACKDKCAFDNNRPRWSKGNGYVKVQMVGTPQQFAQTA